MTTRRLAAILAADVAGFSAMMERDEEGTAARIRKLRAEIIEPALARHQGRLVKTTGDGFLAEFASPVEAVRSAIAIQDQLASANGVSLRIGINLGDIIIEDDGDLLGDGVNVAARLEQIAEPGGLAISGWVNEAVAGKIDRPFDDRGEQQVKNIARPVRVYSLAAAAPRRDHVSPPPPRDNPSIAVLPFANMSGDPEQSYFADGLTTALSADLSRVSGALIIASSTTATLKGHTGDATALGRELGVRYLVRGGVQKGAGKVRINVQLVETHRGTQLWADRLDGDESDLFDLQDQITTRIANAVGRRITALAAQEAEAKGNATAIDHLLRGLALSDLPQTLDNLAAQEEHFRKALRLATRHAETMARLGRALCLQGWQFGPLLEESVAKAKLAEGKTLADTALSIDPENAYAHIPKGIALWAEGNYPDALFVFENALALDRNLVLVSNNLATTLVRLGRPSEAIPHAKQAIRLDPRGPQVAVPHVDMGNANLLLGEFGAAVSWFGKARSLNAKLPRLYPGFAAALANSGDVEGARAIVQELRTIAPQFRLSQSPDFPTRYSPVAYRELFETIYLPGAKLAGLPE